MDMFSWLSKEKVLKGGILSEDWLTLCELALPLNYYDLGEITTLVAMPCELGTIVVKDSGVFSAEEMPCEMIQKWLTIHRFVPTELKPHSLGAVSLMTPNFCLAGIPESQGMLWVNPLRVYQLYCGNEGVLVELMNGLKLDVSIACQDFLRCTVETFYIFSHQHSNSFRFLDTPFSRFLEKQLTSLEALLSYQEPNLAKKLLVHPRLLKEETLFGYFVENPSMPSPCLTTA